MPVPCVENTARSWYDGGYVNLRRRHSHALSLLANYIWAPSIPRRLIDLEIMHLAFLAAGRDRHAYGFCRCWGSLSPGASK
jgi:hypothetical protein